jgi:hypothetical protein
MATVSAMAPSQQTSVWALATSAEVEPLATNPPPPEPPQSPVIATPPSLPAGVVALLDVFAGPAESGSYDAPAEVISYENDVLDLDIGDRLPLTLLARTRGAHFPVVLGDQVDLYYDRSGEPFAPHQVIVLTDGEDALAGILLSGDAPLSTDLDLTQTVSMRLEQTGSPATQSGLMRALVTIGTDTADVAPLVEAELGDWRIILIDSRGPGIPIEGPPYGLRAVVWRATAQ